jgi:citrate lyase beta subunit
MANETTQFEPGGSGNPGGRSKVTRYRSTMALEAIFDGQSEALTRTVIELANDGDTVALRICMDRLMPVRKDTPITFVLPEIETAADLTKATKALPQGVADGEITPSEAAELPKLVDVHTKAFEAVDLANRLSALEQAAVGKR